MTWMKADRWLWIKSIECAACHVGTAKRLRMPLIERLHHVFGADYSCSYESSWVKVRVRYFLEYMDNQTED